MVISAAFAFFHFLAVFGIFATVFLEWQTMSSTPTYAEARRIQLCDKWFGIFAGVVLVVGFLRVFYFEKGKAFYTLRIPSSTPNSRCLCLSDYCQSIPLSGSSNGVLKRARVWHQPSPTRNTNESWLCCAPSLSHCSAWLCVPVLWLERWASNNEA